MPRYRVRLDSDGIAEVLKSDSVANVIGDYAEKVRDATDEAIGDYPVRVARYVTDRAAAAVTIAHPAGLNVEAKYGALNSAAVSAGLEVTARKE